MANLEEIRASAERLVTAVSDALRLEIAIFDDSSNLFFCAPTYLKKKGRVVHAPFIREVIENGSVLVNKPGEMPSCIGCRFKEHCPSTIEVLCCIHAGTEIAGVASFTSFTKEGQRRIIDSTAVYLNAITELANLIGDLLANKTGKSGFANLDATLAASMELCPQPVLLTDPHGVILQYNQMASNFLKFCNSTSSSLWQLFPEAVVRKIMDGTNLFEKNVTIGNMATKITTRAVMNGEQISAFFIRLSGELSEPEAESGFFGRIVGQSSQIETIHRLIKKVADSPTPVLITGETGTGKELVARAIHEQSCRSKYPFVAVNCSGIPDTLFESELFGYEEGSFTGAKKGGKIGKIEMAQGGTLFLDEIGELPLFAQPKLLRVLQEYELERVGSNKKVHLDIRIIAATNRSLSEMVAERTFRGDLFYRINVINLKLPPLRSRREDIMPIAASYLEHLRSRIRTPLKKFAPETEELLVSYDWPGNVRELQNMLEYAANLCETDTLTPADLPEILTLKARPCEKTEPGPAAVRNSGEQVLAGLLEKYGYTLEGKKQIAAELGISLRTLYRKLNRLNIQQPDITLPR